VQKASDAPGPGHYESSLKATKSTLVGYKLSKTGRGEVASKSMSQLPGPGQYESKMGKGGPVYTFTGKGRESSQNDSPGPGGYEPNESHTRVRSPAAHISKSPKKEGRREDSPGPGNYDSEVRKGGPSYTIGTKREQKQFSEAPGPGSYSGNDSLTKTRIVSHKLGETKRTEIVSRDKSGSPGPGNYHEDKKFGKDAVSFTIGQKRAS